MGARDEMIQNEERRGAVLRCSRSSGTLEYETQAENTQRINHASKSANTYALRTVYRSVNTFRFRQNPKLITRLNPTHPTPTYIDRADPEIP